MLRAGPFSDERVVRLANRRFVPFYFDLSDRGAAGDPAARKLVVAARPELGGRSVPTPPVLFMTREGEVLGEVSNYATEQQVLDAMLEVLDEHPEYARPSKAEAEEEDPFERARILIDLVDYDGAWKILTKQKGSRAHYLLGHLSRRAADWSEMERHLEQVDDAELADDVLVERAWRLWAEGDHVELHDSLAEIPGDSNRYTEARYLAGLALYHQGLGSEALELWKELVRGCPQDPWIYRADWAYTQAGEKKGGGRVFSTSRGSRSLLGRIGYMGRRNPDLERR